jgi:DnaJ family protein C protein 19
MTTAIAIGVGIAAAAGVASVAMRAYGAKQAGGAASVLGKSFYRGGFEGKMTKREAALILGVRETVQRDKLKEAHRRIMLANHVGLGESFGVGEVWELMMWCCCLSLLGFLVPMDLYFRLDFFAVLRLDWTLDSPTKEALLTSRVKSTRFVLSCS